MARPKNAKVIQNEVAPRGDRNPLVFISHDTRDAELAEAFSKLLSSVSAGVLKSFRSSDRKGNQGIAYGVEWYPEIMQKLDEASDVVALLTKHSVDRPWILYEAGVAKGKLNTPLLGISIGIKLSQANNGPFAQFQNSEDDVESLIKLVVQLVGRIPNAEPDKEVIRMQVEAFKKRTEEILSKEPELDKPLAHGIGDDSTVAKLFEEVKIMFQDLPARIERRSEKGRRRHFHPKRMHELIHKSEVEVDVAFLMMISMFKDQLPWIYEVGKETWHILRNSESKEEKERTISDFLRIVKASRYPIMMDEFGTSRDHFYMLDELHFLFEDLIPKLGEGKKGSLF